MSSFAHVEGFSEPFPGDVGKQRVPGDGIVQVCLDVGHQAHRTFPGFLSAWVVQQDEAAEGIAFRVSRDKVPVFCALNLEAYGVAEWEPGVAVGGWCPR